MGKDELYGDFASSDASNSIADAEDEILYPLMDELESIQDHDIRMFTRAMLLKATSFWYIPSSASMHYPPDEQMEGGLVLHTQRVFRVVEILGSLYELESIEVDKLKSAALLHDITKASVVIGGNSPVYDYLHPYTVDGLYTVVKKDDELNSGSNMSNVLTIDQAVVDNIFKAIRAHKGNKSPVPETVPAKNSLPMLFHVANEIAKSVHYIVDGDEVVIERWLEVGEQE